MISKNLVGASVRLANACGMWGSTNTHAPGEARKVSSPTWNSSSPSRTYQVLLRSFVHVPAGVEARRGYPFGRARSVGLFAWDLEHLASAQRYRVSLLGGQQN